MIFEKMTTVHQERTREVANIGQWGGIRAQHFPEISSEQADERHAQRRQVLLDNACIPLADAAQEFHFDADEYMALAQDKQALAFVLEDGEILVPVWGLDIKKQIRKTAIDQSIISAPPVNPVAVEMAKMYMARRPHWENPSDFCRFLSTKYVVMRPGSLYSERNPNKTLRSDFLDRAYQGYLKQPQSRGVVRTLMEGISMATGKNYKYVSECLRDTVELLLDVNHVKPDSLEGIMNKMAQDSQSAKTKGAGVVRNIIR